MRAVRPVRPPSLMPLALSMYLFSRFRRIESTLHDMWINILGSNGVYWPTGERNGFLEKQKYGLQGTGLWAEVSARADG